MYDCRRLGAVGDCVISILPFGFRRRLFVFGRFEQEKYIQSETINQISCRQYVAELESKVF